MSQELFNTSVRRGLKPGSSGFCTVAMTAGLSPLIEERLTLLSGYRWIYPPGQPESRLNPVAWAHWMLSIGGRTHHVISRVSDAGLDYSGRSNRFAHHVVLEPSELPVGGPAWLMLQPGSLQGHFEGDPRVLPQGRVVPLGDRPAAPCKRWEAITGDAGWGGVLAESFLRDPDTPTYILARPDLDLLPLLAESLALLPMETRWRVTFSTYFTDLPIGMTCAWRCCVVGTKAADDADRVSKQFIIDLTRPTEPAPNAPCSVAARTGQMLSPNMRSASSATAITESSSTSIKARKPASLALSVASFHRTGTEDATHAPASSVEEINADEEGWTVVPSEDRHNLGQAPGRGRGRIAFWIVAILWPTLAIPGAVWYGVNLGTSQSGSATDRAKAGNPNAIPSPPYVGTTIGGPSGPSTTAPASDAARPTTSPSASIVKQVPATASTLPAAAFGATPTTGAARTSADSRTTAPAPATVPEPTSAAARIAPMPTTASAPAVKRNPPDSRATASGPPTTQADASTRAEPPDSAAELGEDGYVEIVQPEIILWRGIPGEDPPESLSFSYGDVPDPVLVDAPRGTPVREIALKRPGTGAQPKLPPTVIGTITISGHNVVLVWTESGLDLIRDNSKIAQWLQFASIKVYGPNNRELGSRKFFPTHRCLLNLQRRKVELSLRKLRGPHELKDFAILPPPNPPAGWNCQATSSSELRLTAQTGAASFAVTVTKSGSDFVVVSSWATALEQVERRINALAKELSDEQGTLEKLNGQLKAEEKESEKARLSGEIDRTRTEIGKATDEKNGYEGDHKALAELPNLTLQLETVKTQVIIADVEVSVQPALNKGT